MARLIGRDDVCDLEHNMLSDCDMFGEKEKDAEAMVNYIAGVHDMASYVIHWISKMDADTEPPKEES